MEISRRRRSLSDNCGTPTLPTEDDAESKTDSKSDTQRMKSLLIQLKASPLAN